MCTCSCVYFYERKERQKQALAYFVFHWLYGPAERWLCVERWLCKQLGPGRGVGSSLPPSPVEADGPYACLKPQVGLEGCGSRLSFAALLTSLPW